MGELTLAKRTTILAAILLAIAIGSANAARYPRAARGLVGAWDITVHGAHEEIPSWLQIEASGSTLVGRFVGRFGSARPLSKVDYADGTMSFTMPPQYEGRELVFEGKLDGDKLSGTVTGYEYGSRPWTAVRAPELKRDHPPKWGKPRDLLNGKNLDGWHPVGFKSNWIVKDGILVNEHSGANLVSNEKFGDFNLNAEFRYPKGSNSGVYLHGRDEVQIVDEGGSQLEPTSIAGIYGFFAPCVDVVRGPDKWQTFDVTLIGRVVTVVFNGERVIDRQTIPGITGGALDSDEGTPGPFMIQGDHGPVEFRKFVVTPAR